MADAAPLSKEKMTMIEDEDVSDSAIVPADEELEEPPAEATDHENKKAKSKRKRR